VSPKRGDRDAPPPKEGKDDIQFADNPVAAGWEQLCAHAVGNARRAWEVIVADPSPEQRHHQLKHALATRAYRDRRPRKTLGFKTPTEALEKALIEAADALDRHRLHVHSLNLAC
jgi:hypothetical protein